MLKIVVLIIVCALLVLYLKSAGSELYPLALIGSGVLVLYSGFTYVTEMLDLFQTLIARSGMGEGVVGIVFKVVSIGYIVEFGAGVVEDMGLKSLSDKLVFMGKIIIIGVSLPVFCSVAEVVSGLL